MRTCAYLLLIPFLAIHAGEGYACAAFSFQSDGHVIVGANTDSCDPVDGLITVNKRNIGKKGGSPGTTGIFAKWVSLYGSITFTYCCREIAQYGMNEAGLTITTVGLPGSLGPAPDERPPLDGNIWAQYLLDTCSTIEEVIASEAAVRLVNTKDQYLICDHTGNTLIVECLDGRIAYVMDRDLPSPVLTNARYDECLRNWERDRIPSNDPYISFRRFNIGSDLLARARESAPEEEITFSFEVLDRISQHPCTQWNLVFNVTDRTIHYRTKDATQIKSLDMSKIDFSCDSPMLEQSVHLDIRGDATSHFTAYSTENNLNLMRKAFRTFGIERTEAELHQIVDFFDSFRCAQ